MQQFRDPCCAIDFPAASLTLQSQLKFRQNGFRGPEVQRQQRCAALRQLPPRTNAVLSNFRADCTASSQVAASSK